MHALESVHVSSAADGREQADSRTRVRQRYRTLHSCPGPDQPTENIDSRCRQLTMLSLTFLALSVAACSAVDRSAPTAAGFDADGTVMAGLNDGDLAAPADYRDWPVYLADLDKVEAKQIRRHLHEPDRAQRGGRRSVPARHGIGHGDLGPEDVRRRRTGNRRERQARQGRSETRVRHGQEPRCGRCGYAGAA